MACLRGWGAGFASRENPRTGAGEVGLHRHWLGSGSGGGFGLSGGSGGFGGAGNEALGQLDRTFHRAARGRRGRPCGS